MESAGCQIRILRQSHSLIGTLLRRTIYNESRVPRVHVDRAKHIKPDDYGYTFNYYKSGDRYARIKDCKAALPKPELKDNGRWSSTEAALVGRNDYIDILGDGSIHPAQLQYHAPSWLRGFPGDHKAKELIRLLHYRNLYKNRLRRTSPKTWHDLCKRINWLLQHHNYQKSDEMHPERELGLWDAEPDFFFKDKNRRSYDEPGLARSPEFVLEGTSGREEEGKVGYTFFVSSKQWISFFKTIMISVPLWTSKVENKSARNGQPGGRIRGTQPAPSKAQLIDMLNALVQMLLNASACSSSCETVQFTREKEEVKELCRVLDRLFSLDLTYVSAGYWPAVSQFLSRSQKQQIDEVWQPKSRRAYCLCWLYQSLNDNLLEFHLRCFANNRPLLSAYYGNRSFLTDKQSLLAVADYLRYIDDVEFAISLPIQITTRSVPSRRSGQTSRQGSLRSNASTSSKPPLPTRRGTVSNVPVAARAHDTQDLEASVNDSTCIWEDPLIKLLNRAVAVCEPEQCEEAITHETVVSAVPVSISVTSVVGLTSTSGRKIVDRKGKHRSSRRFKAGRSSQMEDTISLTSSINVSMDLGTPRSSTPKAPPLRGDRDEESLFREVMASTSMVRNGGANLCQLSQPVAEPFLKKELDWDRGGRTAKAANWIMDQGLYDRAHNRPDMDTDSISSGAAPTDPVLTYEERLLSQVPSQSQLAADSGTPEVDVNADSNGGTAVVGDSVEPTIDTSESRTRDWKTPDYTQGDHRLQSGEIVELALQIFEEDNEQFYKLYRVYGGVSLGEPCERWLVLTNARVYLCHRRTDKHHARINMTYTLVHSIPLHDIDCAITSLNYQSISFVRRSNRDYIDVDTASEHQTRSILSSLDVSSRRCMTSTTAPCIIETPDAQLDVLTKWLAQEFAIQQPIIDVYSLIFWRVQPAVELADVLIMYNNNNNKNTKNSNNNINNNSNNNNNFESNGTHGSSHESRCSRNGYLYARYVYPEAWYGKRTDWGNQFFMLRSRKLYVFTDSSCREGIEIIDLRRAVSGCRESTSEEHLDCVDVMLADDPYNKYLQLAAPTKHEAQQWLSAIMTAVSLADDTEDDASHSTVSCCLLLTEDLLVLGQENKQYSFVRTLASIRMSHVLTITAVSTHDKCALLIAPKGATNSPSAEVWWLCVRNRHEFEKIITHLENLKPIERVCAQQLLEESQMCVEDVHADEEEHVQSSHSIRTRLVELLDQQPDYWSQLALSVSVADQSN